MVFHIDFGYPV